MKIRVIDFETTGTPEDQTKAICEIGYTDLLPDAILPTVSFLVNPGHPIPAVTRAVHHISDDDVKDAISPDVASRALMEDMGPADIFAAHNAKFEQAFFGGGSHRWICSLICAKHIWPEAPRHSNQVLRYWLEGLNDEINQTAAMPPHRAGPDSYVTAHILTRLLQSASADKLVELTTTPVLLQQVTFGKHRGKKWKDLPWDYLSWIVKKSDLGPDEKHTARHYLGAR